MAWWVQYLGRPYVEGRFECSDLVIEVLRAEFGLDLGAWRPPEGAQARQAQEVALRRRFLGRRIDYPLDGDCVLMVRRSGRRARGWHVGLAAGAQAVLHCVPEAGVVRTRIADLARIDYQWEGYYRWAG